MNHFKSLFLYILNTCNVACFHNEWAKWVSRQSLLFCQLCRSMIYATHDNKHIHSVLLVLVYVCVLCIVNKTWDTPAVMTSLQYSIYGYTKCQGSLIASACVLVWRGRAGEGWLPAGFVSQHESSRVLATATMTGHDVWLTWWSLYRAWHQTAHMAPE